MTLQQEAAGLVYKLPNYQLEHIVGLMKSMIITANAQNDRHVVISTKQDTAKRIGIAKGKVGSTDYFDKHNGEIAEMFEGCV